MTSRAQIIPKRDEETLTSREGGTSAGPKKDVWDDHQVTEERGFQAKKEPEQRQVILKMHEIKHVIIMKFGHISGKITYSKELRRDIFLHWELFLFFK